MTAQQKLQEIKEAWNAYKLYLQEKYPAPPGEKWDFTCEYHRKIDKILNQEGE